uniref:Glutathione peroxidase n=1 Tax=Timema poppense TaxID=170557 RepID=A0A7R9DM67_TIMPO|nr:unnamed protein product [Timema poppensis]
MARRWSDDTVMNFVNLYGSESVLWDSTSVDYRNKTLRNEAQEPGANASEISNGIRHVRPGNGFTPNFLLFKKIHVNGDQEQPLFTYLKKQCPPTRNGFAESKNLFYSPLMNNDIRWNFEKFLVNRQGVPVKRYDPSTIPDDIHNDISELTQHSELSFTGK